MPGAIEHWRRWASIYDQIFPAGSEADAAAGMLARLAGGGRVLEFGVGTGRIALPLAARGVAVHGLDVSAEMIAELREKPGGRDIPVTVGDMCSTRVSGDFSLVFAAFNSLLVLPGQEDQVRCFQNAASHLRAGGLFVVEAIVIDPAGPSGFSEGGLRALYVGDSEVWLEAASYDAAAQLATVQSIRIRDDGVRLYPNNLRYASPAELDLMARLAGFALRERFAGWACTPFGTGSGNHVSVYELCPPAPPGGP